MFTGIITDLGTVRHVQKNNEGDARVRVGTAYDVEGIAIGASIAHNGICLTVVEKGADEQGHWFDVVASSHTQAITTLGSWQAGDALNLERALKMGDELGGHMVSGHVDAVTQVVSREAQDESSRFGIAIPTGFAPFIAEKGSVTLDGVSLTVAEIQGDIFYLALIPHTLEVTNLGKKHAGDTLNLEVDLIARYLKRMQDASKSCG